MFGINDDNSQPATDQAQPVAASPADTGAPAIMDNPFTGNDGAVTATDSPAPAVTGAPAVPAETPAAPIAPVVSPSPTPTPAATGSSLLELKQQALQNLAPLVEHLGQTPEEKFKTTMMLIQASDNSDLIKEAYEAANQIPDEKARAQALLDVVNEINYFTHHSNNSN
jgi:hypothetical protein